MEGWREFEAMKATKRKMSDLEARFLLAWRALNGPAPTCEANA